MVSVLLTSVALLLVAGPQDGPRPQPGKTSRPAGSAGRAEYLALRAKTPDTADAHWKLGLWCEKNGLKAESLIEFEAVTQLDSRREAAWKRLGYVKHDGRWTTAAQVAALKAETEAQRKADAHWRPLLQKWKTALGRKDKRSEAAAALAAVNDPRATPSIWKVFGTGTPEDQERAIDMLGHIEGERPSRALAGLAVFGKTDLVRRAAVETLSRRKADAILMAWIGLLRAPIKYEVRQVAGAGSPGVLFVEGQQFNFRRFYSPPSVSQTESLFVDGTAPVASGPMFFSSNDTAAPPPGSRPVGEAGGITLYVYDYTWRPPNIPKEGPGPTNSYQAFEKSVLQAVADRDFEFNEAANMAAGAQAQLQSDVNAVESANATIRERNARLAEALHRVSGKDLGEDREAWLKWWMDKRGYSYTPPNDQPKPTVDVQVPLPYVPTSGPHVGPNVAPVGGGGGRRGWCMIWEHDKGQKPRTGPCFTAGTLVLTPDGPRGIETLRAGDAVLTGTEQRGAPLAASIVSVHQSLASRTLRLVVDGDEIVTTEGHPFLMPGAGWIRAGDLKPGDEIQAIRGLASVESCQIGESAAVWNLRLSGASRFLVGGLGLIVHDLGPVGDCADLSEHPPNWIGVAAAREPKTYPDVRAGVDKLPDAVRSR